MRSTPSGGTVASLDNGDCSVEGGLRHVDSPRRRFQRARDDATVESDRAS
jgi:hypothetical protein